MSPSTWLCPHGSVHNVVYYYSELCVVDVEVDIEVDVEVGVEVGVIEYFVSQYMALYTQLLRAL